MPTPRKHLRCLTATMVALAGGLAACGGVDGDTGADIASLDTSTTSTAEDPAGDAEPGEALLRYTECMREQGVDMPDPVQDGGDVFLGAGTGVDAEKMEAGNEVCMPSLEEVLGSFDPPTSEELAETEQEMLEFASCMRDEGLDWPDPQVSAEGTITIDGPAGLDLDSDEVQDAADVCGGDGPGLFGGRVDG